MRDRPIHTTPQGHEPSAPRRATSRASLTTSPLPPVAHVPRPRLVAYIEEPSLAPLTLIFAAAGTGKTTLASEWSRHATIPVRWLPLTEADNDPARLEERLRQTILRGDSQQPPTDGADGSPDSVLADIAALDHDLCIVIDDCDVLLYPGCHALLNDVISVTSSRLHLILIGRKSLPLRLGRLRALGRVRELGTAELRFTRTEAKAVLRELAPSGLPPAEVDRLVERAEGWAAGIVLSGIALRQAVEDQDRRPGAETQVRTDVLDDYVREEILATLPAEQQDFVLSTCALPWLEARFCDAAIGTRDAAGMLAALDAQFPFLTRDGISVGRYRYHPLVRESLCRLAGGEEAGAAAVVRGRRAATWLIDAGELESAADLGLNMRDPAAAASMIEPHCRHLADRSDFAALGRWLDRVPESVFERSLDLGWWRIVAAIGGGSGRIFGTGALLDAMEARALASGSPLHIARLHLGRGALAYFAGHDDLASERLIDALQRLPADAVVERMYATWLLGDIAFRNGRDDNAAAAFKEAEACAGQLPLDERWSWLVIAPGRANGYAIRGDIHSAITKYRLILAELPPYLAGVSLEGFLRCRLISLLIERNDLHEAREEYTAVEGLLDGEPHPWHRDAMLAKGRLLLAEGRRDEAEQWAAEHLRQLRRLPGKTQLVHLLARIWLEKGEYPLVESWLADISMQDYPWIQVFGDTNYRILAIGLDLVRGRFEEAASASERMADEAKATNRWAEVIQLSVRWAVALHGMGRIEQSHEVLRSVLDLGAKGGFVRGFYVPGFDTATMFADVWSESRLYQPVRRGLLQIIGHTPRPAAVVISEREVEVLRLVAEGRSNQQIAASMFISANTVRNHLVRIGQRLQARNRQEAVTRARELGLLD